MRYPDPSSLSDARISDLIDDYDKSISLANFIAALRAEREERFIRYENRESDARLNQWDDDRKDGSNAE
jgi:hypothetical protein